MRAPRSKVSLLASAIAALLLAPRETAAIWSFAPPKDSLWRIALESRVLMIRTGDARLDDGIEEGFRKSWPSKGGWAWAPDSGIRAVAKDTNAMVFQWVEPRGYGRKTAGNDCQKLTGAERRSCVQDQASGFFMLTMVGKKLGRRDGAWLLLSSSQVRQLEHGDAFVIDVVTDFALALEAMRDSLYPVDGPLVDDRAWARETITRERRSKAHEDTLWVPRQVAGKVSDSVASALFGSPVRFVGADTLETMMGSARKGSYLEPGLRAPAPRQLRVRSLATGELLAIDDRRAALPSDSLLNRNDLARLAHRTRAEEERPSLMISGGYEGSYTELMGITVIAGYEVKRGLWALAGYSPEQVGPDDKQGATQSMAIVGVRFCPLLGWERPTLGQRFAIGARYWQPLWDAKEAEDGRELDVAPRITLDLDFLFDYMFIGISHEIWLGENSYKAPASDKQETGYYSYSSSSEEDDDKLDPGGLCFRGGFHFGLPTWRPAPKWKSAKERNALKR